jgi:hypothetical protein
VYQSTSCSSFPLQIDISTIIIILIIILITIIIIIIIITTTTFIMTMTRWLHPDRWFINASLIREDNIVCVTVYLSIIPGTKVLGLMADIVFQVTVEGSVMVRSALEHG